MDALDYEYNHDARTQSQRPSAARLQLAVGRRGLGAINRGQEEQPTQRASSAATYVYHARPHRAVTPIVLGSDDWLKKYHVKRLGTSLRGQSRISQRRLGCLSPGPSEVHSARRQT